MTLLAGCLSALWLIPRLRRLAVLGLFATSAVWCAFVVNVYFSRAAPHFGQRELLLAYYAHRTDPRQPIVAYQMNWKGENFYTGNRVSVFVTSGAPFQRYLDGLRARGERVMFVMTEHRRKSLLLEELGPVRHFRALTTSDVNSKFLLARVDL
jgi:hypothetical protein